MCPVLEKPVKNSSPKRSGSVIVNDNDDDDNGNRDINQSYVFITNIYGIFVLCLTFFLTITLNLNSYTLQTCIYFNMFNFYFSCF